MSLHFHNFLWIPIIPILKYNSIYFLSLQTLKTDPHNNRWIDPAKAILRVLVCICVFILLICECHTHSIDAYNGLGTEKHFQMSLGYTFDISMMTNNMRGLSHSSEIRGLRSTKCSSEILQNLLYFMYKKIHVVFFVFHFVQLYIFT